MTYQYLRRCVLVVGNANDTINLEGLKIVFKVTHRTVQTQSTLTARIYNLSQPTMDKIYNEFTSVVLQAGYENWSGEILGNIFAGSIVQARIGRENPTDTFLDIVAADGDYAYIWATTNKTLASGYTLSDVKKTIDKAFEQYGVKTGNVAEMSGNRSVRGRVLFGMARDHARDLAFTAGHTWSIKSSQYETVDLHGVLPDSAVIELTSHTGLIGLPQRTAEGVVARALLNPNIWHNRRVKIDNKSVQRAAFPTPVSPEAFVNFGWLSDTAIAADGLYKVIAADHTGDTRGNTWYTDMWLLPVNYQGLVSPSTIGMDVGPEGPPQLSPTVSTPAPPSDIPTPQASEGTPASSTPAASPGSTTASPSETPQSATGSSAATNWANVVNTDLSPTKPAPY